MALVLPSYTILSFTKSISVSSYNSVNIIKPLVWISTEFETWAKDADGYGIVVAAGGYSKACCLIRIALVKASAVFMLTVGPV